MPTSTRSRCTSNPGVGAHCICAREGTDKIAGAIRGGMRACRPTGAPPNFAHPVGVDLLIDPRRFCGQIAAYSEGAMASRSSSTGMVRPQGQGDSLQRAI